MSCGVTTFKATGSSLATSGIRIYGTKTIDGKTNEFKLEVLSKDYDSAAYSFVRVKEVLATACMSTQMGRGKGEYWDALTQARFGGTLKTIVRLNEGDIIAMRGFRYWLFGRFRHCGYC